eukprot:GAHX01001297.1.p1 GENE.GAHX01001297.1~~GAHX01001297.1.p1  ORF type:complete len:332 (+),score=50.15 GAHX01001297.1:285-1280(+)
MLNRTQIFYFLLLSMSSITSKQSLKCLLKLSGKETFFINLTFECNKMQLQKTGCLTNVSVDFFYYSSLYKYLTLHSGLVDSPQGNLIIKYENIDIFKAINKNKYQRNEKVLEFRNSNSTKVTIGIPLHIENKLLRAFNKLYTEDIINDYNFPINNMSLILPITYKIEDSYIYNIKLPNENTELIMCKDITEELGYETEGLTSNVFESNMVKCLGNKHSSTSGSILFKRYEELYNQSIVTKGNIKLIAVAFLNRIDLKKTNSNEDTAKLKLFSNYDNNPLMFLKHNGMLFTLTDLSEEERSDAYLNSNYKSLSLYKLEKVYGNGEKARESRK